MSMILNMLHMQIVTRTCSSVLPVAKYSPVDENSAHIVAPSCPCKLYIIWPSRKSQICRTRQDHVTRRSSLTSTCRTNQAVRRNLDNWVAYARYYKVVKKLTKRHLLVWLNLHKWKEGSCQMDGRQQSSPPLHLQHSAESAFCFECPIPEPLISVPKRVSLYRRLHPRLTQITTTLWVIVSRGTKLLYIYARLLY